jgi:formamidopyrimidine-DNA glycosylase
VPELPEVELVRRELEPAMEGVRIERVILRRAGLREPFPKRFAERLAGQTVASVGRRAKYLVAALSSGETLLMHLGMSGSFGVSAAEPAPFDKHDHVVFRMSSGTVIVFNDPRRFGVMDLLSPARLSKHAAVARLGPEPLSDDFAGAALARACKGRKVALKAALLDQRVVAGLGNIYASEALHTARLSPLRRARTIATPQGQPRESAHRLAAAIKKVLSEAIARQSNPAYRSARFRVYEREGERCLRPRCGGIIRRRTQAGRSTFYCPRCQG